MRILTTLFEALRNSWIMPRQSLTRNNSSDVKITKQANTKLLLMPSVILIVLRWAQQRKGILATVQTGFPNGQLNINRIIKGSDTRDLRHIFHGYVNVWIMIERTSILVLRIIRGLLIVNGLNLIKVEYSIDDWGTLNRRSKWRESWRISCHWQNGL